jgi:FkbM family methyltransferase
VLVDRARLWRRNSGGYIEANNMLEHQGIFLPDGEKHLVEWMNKAGELIDGKGSYQIKKLRAALKYCKLFRTAIDVGAHCGLWSMQLAKRFDIVHAFEPVEAHAQCLLKNCTGGVALHRCALGESTRFVSIHSTPTSSGDSWVDGVGDIPMQILDGFDFENVDFIKLDCEGGELPALRGGEKMILRDMPVIIVEQKPGKAQKFGLPETGAVEYLKTLGYRQAECLSGDYIMVKA